MSEYIFLSLLILNMMIQHGVLVFFNPFQQYIDGKRIRSKTH